MVTEFITNFDEWFGHLSTSFPVAVYVVIFCIVFLETAFFPVAPILPGDGLLFLIGILSASGSISFWIAVATLIAGATLGNIVAYKIGVWFAPKKGEKLKWLKAEHYAKAQKFYDKHGVNALFYSRYIPMVRSIVPLIAGIAFMNYKTFVKYSIVSVALWVFTITIAAYYLGQIPWIKENFAAVILIFSLVSALPIFLMWIKIKLLQLKNKR